MGKYDDIIDLPHHVSATRPRMSMQERAAQFSPFAALVGFDDAIRETAYLTDEDEEMVERVDVSEISDACFALNESEENRTPVAY